MNADRRQLALWSAAILIGGLVIIIRTERSSSDLRGFHSVWAANWRQPAVENRADPEDPYAPSFYVLFAPLGALPLWGAAAVIYAINIFCAWAIVRMTIRLLAIPPPERAALWIPAIGVAPFFLGTLTLGQNTLILIALVMAAVVVAGNGREFLAGGLIGLASAIKVYPILFLAPYLLRLRWRVVAGCLSSMLFIAGLMGTLFFGYETNLNWTQSWGRFVTRADQDRPEDPHFPKSMRCTARYNNQAVHAVLARVMLDVPAKWYGDRFQVNLLACDAATWRAARSAMSGLFLLLGAVALWGLRRSPQNPAEGVSVDAWELALVCCWFFTLSPMVWTHYLVWAFFPLACVTRRRAAQPRLAVIVLGVWFAAECLIGSKYCRALGVNLLAGVALFADLAAPGLQRAWSFLRQRRTTKAESMEQLPLPKAA